MDCETVKEAKAGNRKLWKLCQEEVSRMATTIRHDLNKLLKAAYTTAYSYHDPPLFTQTPAGIKEDRAVAETLQKDDKFCTGGTDEYLGSEEFRSMLAAWLEPPEEDFPQAKLSNVSHHSLAALA
ncbi:hypothetical protein WJX84_005737 [Apatococcus fuscideae]|uniref:Uncharacterized protein n=1 Tax=Apatococcus fuscideae TaxID=2026836 RepID=A0AAW1TLF6_9CHLO